MSNLRRWVKARGGPGARLLYGVAKWSARAQVPPIYWLHRPLYDARSLVLSAWRGIYRAAWATPLFQACLVRPAPRLNLFGGIPLVIGGVDIEIGSDCRMSGGTTIAGRTGPVRPRLAIGRNVYVGWQTTFSVGRTIRVGDNVLIAGRAFLAGYPGHPLDPIARAAGHPDTDDQVGDIVIEDDVWIAMGVTILAGVRIGRGTVVGAGSVVTRDLPPGVIAAGSPARVLRPLPCPSGGPDAGRETRHRQDAMAALQD